MYDVGVTGPGRAPSVTVTSSEEEGHRAAAGLHVHQEHRGLGHMVGATHPLTFSGTQAKEEVTWHRVPGQHAKPVALGHNGAHSASGGARCLL